MLLSFCKALFKVYLSLGQWGPLQSESARTTDLEFFGQLHYGASIFIVFTCVPPDKANFVFERIPSFEESSWRYWSRVTAFYALDGLSEALQRHRMLYESIIVL